MAKSHFVGHVDYFAHCVPLLSCSTFLASYVMSGFWTNQMWSCLKKLLVVHNQTHVSISCHSSLLRSQQGCQHVMTAMFVESISRGLSPTFLIIWHVNLISNMSHGVNAAATVAPNIPNDSSHVNTSYVLQGASCSRRNLRSLSMYESHWIL
jgi:hypothetical protein